MELVIYIKMDLVLNNLQRLICHKTQQTKPTSSNAGALGNEEYPFIVIYSPSRLGNLGFDTS